LHPEASTELRSTMQNSYIHHASDNGLTVLIPADGVTLNFLIEGELGCFHCIKVRFDSG
jgi:hypothetical protein